MLPRLAHATIAVASGRVARVGSRGKGALAGAALAPSRAGSGGYQRARGLVTTQGSIVALLSDINDAVAARGGGGALAIRRADPLYTARVFTRATGFEVGLFTVRREYW